MWSLLKLAIAIGLCLSGALAEPRRENSHQSLREVTGQSKAASPRLDGPFTINLNTPLGINNISGTVTTDARPLWATLLRLLGLQPVATSAAPAVATTAVASPAFAASAGAAPAVAAPLTATSLFAPSNPVAQTGSPTVTETRITLVPVQTNVGLTGSPGSGASGALLSQLLSALKPGGKPAPAPAPSTPGVTLPSLTELIKIAGILLPLLIPPTGGTRIAPANGLTAENIQLLSQLTEATRRGYALPPVSAANGLTAENIQLLSQLTEAARRSYALPPVSAARTVPAVAAVPAPLYTSVPAYPSYYADQTAVPTYYYASPYGQTLARNMPRKTKSRATTTTTTTKAPNRWLYSPQFNNIASPALANFDGQWHLLYNGQTARASSQLKSLTPKPVETTAEQSAPSTPSTTTAAPTTNMPSATLSPLWAPVEEGNDEDIPVLDESDPRWQFVLDDRIKNEENEKNDGTTETRMKLQRNVISRNTLVADDSETRWQLVLDDSDGSAQQFLTELRPTKLRHRVSKRKSRRGSGNRRTGKSLISEENIEVDAVTDVKEKPLIPEEESNMNAVADVEEKLLIPAENKIVDPVVDVKEKLLIPVENSNVNAVADVEEKPLISVENIST